MVETEFSDEQIYLVRAYLNDQLNVLDKELIKQALKASGGDTMYAAFWITDRMDTRGRKIQ